MPLPLLALTVPINEKRSLPPDAPQPEPKRQMVRSSFDEIIADAIKTFGPVLYVCSEEPKTYTYNFWGKDRAGARGWVRLFFRISFDFLARDAKPPGKRSQILSFRVYDTYGMLPNIPDLFANSTPPMVTIPCGGSVKEVTSRVKNVLEGWLDFALRYVR